MTAPSRIVIPMLDFARSGGQRVLAQLATEWTRLGLDVELLTHRSSDEPYFPTDARIAYVGDDGKPDDQRALAGPGSSSAESSTSPLVKMRALRRALAAKRLTDGVAIANHNLTAWPVATARGISRRIYYIQAYEPEYYHSGSFVRRNVLRNLARSTYLLPMTQVVNSPVYLDHPAMRAVASIPPGIDLSIFHPSVTPRSDRKRVIGCVGRKEIEKGTADVLEAFVRLRDTGVDATLRVAYGSVPKALLQRDDIEVVVPANDQELAEFYRSLDVLAAPGHLQLGAIHYPVLEGLACGVPVVHTGYVPGADENSWIVPVKSPAAIARTFETILASGRDADTTRTMAGLQSVEAFSWPSVAARWLPILFDK